METNENTEDKALNDSKALKLDIIKILLENNNYGVRDLLTEAQAILDWIMER